MASCLYIPTYPHPLPCTLTLEYPDIVQRASFSSSRFWVMIQVCILVKTDSEMIAYPLLKWLHAHYWSKFEDILSFSLFSWTFIISLRNSGWASLWRVSEDWKDNKDQINQTLIILCQLGPGSCESSWDQNYPRRLGVNSPPLSQINDPWIPQLKLDCGLLPSGTNSQ